MPRFYQRSAPRGKPGPPQRIEQRHARERPFIAAPVIRYGIRDRMKTVDLMGKQFGRLTVIAPAGTTSKRRLWRAECVCGKHKVVCSYYLTSGRTKSCGCWLTEHCAGIGKRTTTHGHSKGRTRTPEYEAWYGIRSRCANTSRHNYARYGGRGIRVCERWMKFENFLADMGQRPSAAHSLDRIDNDGNYEPTNCRWATRQEQQRNTSHSRKVNVAGVIASVAEHAERAGLPAMAVIKRLDRGWDAVDALSKPLRVTRRSFAKPESIHS